MIYSGAMFPEWRGDAFVGGLSSQALLRIHLSGEQASKGDQWDMARASARWSRGLTVRSGCWRMAATRRVA